MLWVILALLTGVAVFSVLWPLARTPRDIAATAHDVAFYRAQLDEIERAGLAAEEVEAAKAEAGRRLIAAAERDAETPKSGTRLKLSLTAAGVLIFIPLLTLGLYDRIGHPDWPDAPLLARLSQPPERLDLAAAIAQVELHLAQHPEDSRGYDVLIPIYIRLGRYDDAVHTATSALQKLGETPQRLAVFGETLVAASHGEVTEDAQQAFVKAAAQDPPVPLALFYLGLAAAQRGDKAAAKEIWEKLLAQTPQDAPWRGEVAERIAALSDSPADSPADASGMAQKSGEAGASAPPLPAGAAAIAALPPAERQKVIRGMVAKLAARLDENGQDLNGWLQLLRAYKVLNDIDKAREALGAARRNFETDPAGKARIDALARELGLES
jgi:cytochrome c-type biogenesis protein CcmH